MIQKEKKNQPWKLPQRFTWLIVSLVHSLLAMLLSCLLYDLTAEGGAGIGLLVYLLMWHIYPGRFYRRAFIALLTLGAGLMVMSTIIITLDGQLSEDWIKFALRVHNHSWIDRVCWTAVELALLILDFLSRKDGQI